MTSKVKLASDSEIRMLAVTGCIGYGFSESSFLDALDRGIDFIASDAGSADPGPFYLGEGVPFASDRAIERDLRIVLKAARARNIPVLIGSAGGGGGFPHVEHTRAIIRKIAAEEGLRFKMAVIQAEPERALIAERLRDGRVAPLWPAPQIDEKTVLETTRIVAMMGAEPLQAALEAGADVVLAGRCSDSALFAAIPLMHGYDPGLAWHLGKTIECAGAIVRPKTGQDCVVGILRRDHFLVEPAHPDKRCTTETVASHAMYENPSPYEFIEPAGIVNTRDATYMAEDDRIVRVSGSRFEKARQYTVKLEGADLCGHRAMMLAGISDPILIRNIDGFSQQIVERTRAAASDLGIAEGSYTFVVRRYGLDAVIPNRPRPDQDPTEIGLVIEVIAATPSDAASIIAKARYNALHTEFEGRMCTAGNLAFPFAPSDIDVGRAYRFSVWHAMELDDPLEIFPIEMVAVGGGAQ